MAILYIANFNTKITTQACIIRRGLWNLQHKFHLYIIIYKITNIGLSSIFESSTNLYHNHKVKKVLFVFLEDMHKKT